MANGDIIFSNDGWNSSSSYTITTDATATTGGTYMSYEYANPIITIGEPAKVEDMPDDMLTGEGWLDKQLAKYRVAL